MQGLPAGGLLHQISNHLKRIVRQGLHHLAEAVDFASDTKIRENALEKTLKRGR
jgi:hypothetical protein